MKTTDEKVAPGKPGQSTAQACPNCAMERTEWPNPKGYDEGGKTYCCEGCATGSGCTCT